VPPIITRRRPAHALCFVVLCTALLVCLILSATANAATGCPTTATTKAFTQFGDTADYSLLANGAFESGTSGWSLTQAAVVTGNETYRVRSATDTRSLAIKAPGLVVSPSFCVSSAHPSFRFFGRRTNGTWGVLNVKLRWKDSSGRVNETVVGSLSGDPYKSWLPTPALPLATTLPLWQSGSTLSVQLVFDPEDFGGDWAIDDVFIDPYRR
jgi:hypothetical protein